MPQKERWGRPYPDNRDWSIYNERLVKRGEFYLSLDFIDQWDDQLAQMNAGKRGRPFQYPESLRGWPAFTPSCRCPTVRWRDLFGDPRHSFLASKQPIIPRSSAGSSVSISRCR